MLKRGPGYPHAGPSLAARRQAAGARRRGSQACLGRLESSQKKVPARHKKLASRPSRVWPKKATEADVARPRPVDGGFTIVGARRRFSKTWTDSTLNSW